ncbi:hypothetical protein V2A60_000799 [Cordyceps javanica]|uniref:Acyl-CoA dehydrogenase/oxidase n=1 Tax=Cordyceps javanica TaxID=43265 RepID=A0A545V1L1_9HYPO|nr:Acyl-CoA dehydrogenase/oxidase [Cordyceps javanica]TQW07182.1 Acyl-CoA dehydrogenase/oxidase [Cordyceps javanica]
MDNTSELLQLRLWRPDAYSEDASQADRIALSYERARSAAKHIGMTVQDIVTLSPKFWDYHRNFIGTADSAVVTILTIHWNLCIGTIASYAAGRPDLEPVLNELQNFEAVGEFMLTEVGHGLDARNIETTATQLKDGSFDLHTPCMAASKSMPPATPYSNTPRIAVVFARLVVGGQQRGIRPFIVRLHDATAMAPGVTSRLLPSRPGAKVVDHAITTFTHVRLDAFALLGDLDAPQNERNAFFDCIHRVTIGTLSLSFFHVPTLRVFAYVLGRYSQRRSVAASESGKQRPIVSFSTQYTPVLTALTYASVFDAFAKATAAEFMEASSEHVRHALATIFKQTVTHTTKPLYAEMIERCGWQGLYNHNQLHELMLAVQGNSIAEGDILVLCIRLVSEVLLGRYSLPEAKDPTSLLAQHELGIWKEAGEIAMTAATRQGSNRNEEFNMMLLPRVRKLVLATGQRVAFEAAVASGTVMPEMLRLYEATCILDDPSWYVEKAGLASADLYRRHAEAVNKLRPSLEALLQETGASPWVTAPILKDEGWIEFIQRLPTFHSEDKTSCWDKRAVGQDSNPSRL